MKLRLPSYKGGRRGTIKDRNGMDLQKQKILRRSGKNTQKNYTKISS